MTIKVVGAGLGRTGTHSLKVALEQLLGGPCYHMFEVMGHPDHIPLWQAAVDDGEPDWDHIFDGYAATGTPYLSTPHRSCQAFGIEPDRKASASSRAVSKGRSA